MNEEKEVTYCCSRSCTKRELCKRWIYGENAIIGKGQVESWDTFGGMSTHTDKDGNSHISDDWSACGVRGGYKMFLGGEENNDNF